MPKLHIWLQSTQRKYRFSFAEETLLINLFKRNMQKLSAGKGLQNTVAPWWYIGIETYNRPLGIWKLPTCHFTLPIWCKFTKEGLGEKRWSWIFYAVEYALNFWLPICKWNCWYRMCHVSSMRPFYRVEIYLFNYGLATRA